MAALTGFLWIAAIWSLTVLVVVRVWRRSGEPQPLSPLVLRALVLAMLGTQAADASTAGDGLGVDAVIRGLLASAALVFAVRVLLVNGREGRTRAGRRTSLFLLSVYAAIAAFSTFYSVAPIETAGKAYELGVAVVIVWAIATSPRAKVQLRAAVELIVLLWAAELIVAIPGFFLLPSQFVLLEEGRPGFLFTSTMGAPYAHSNGLSSIGAMVAAYALARSLHTRERIARRWWYALAAVGSVGIVLASGRQGVIIWGVGIGLILFLYARPLFVFGAIPLVALAVYEWSGQLWTALTRQQQETTLYTLSGRLDFWQGAIGVWQESPLLGYGFGVGGRLVALPSIGQAAIGSLHSGYFEALVGVGLIGVFPLAAAVVRLVRWSYVRLRQGVDVHLAILVPPMLMHTAISLGFAAWSSSEFLVLALLAAYADLTMRDARRRRLDRPAVTTQRAPSAGTATRAVHG